MAWGDSWGSTPWSYHERFVKAFMEGRELGGQRPTRVERGGFKWQWYFSYYASGSEIARYTPPPMVEEMHASDVADSLNGEQRVHPRRIAHDYYPVLTFRAWQMDKAEARHLKALGVDAEWQYGKRPFLIFGAKAPSDWLTIEEAKALPKWEGPVKPVREPRFVNLTLPLFAS